MNSQGQRTGKNFVIPGNAVKLFVVVALSVGNVLLIAQNLQLRGRLELQPNPTTTSAGPEVGDDVSVLTAAAVEMAGSSRLLRGDKALLIFLSPSCVFCREMSPDLADTLSRLDENLVEAFGIVHDGEDRETVADYLAEYGMEQLRVLYTSAEVLTKLDLVATPTTLIVDDRGVITDVWRGRWSGADKNAVDAAVATGG